MSNKKFGLAWTDNQHVCAERPNSTGYPHACEFGVAADRSRIVQRVSTTLPDDGTEDAKQFIKDAGKAVEDALRKERQPSC